ncbi:hypothetical protein ALC62_08703 [Cyphomyrmex costatus]|uniref:CCHC-type domain-containing protein n=1 Tax=Cyphomyrmex costatus TaxID=456900 RepID=A0A151K2B9_9HYME|nr:hypothetical protein ALC62_08703 [Cyphomyrmex costatus]
MGEYPGFLEDLGDLCRKVREREYTTRGAVVRDWPESREVGLQCGPRRCERATQTDPPEPPRRTIRRSGGNVGEERCARCQREEACLPDLAGDERGRPRERSQDSRRGGVASPDAEACWNCGRTGHRYSTCPRARREFCFGCGRPGVTLRTCTRCQGRWRSLGPYHPARGHDLRRC